MIATRLTPPRKRVRARHRGLFWLAMVIAIFAFAGGGYIAVNSYLGSAQPGDVATAYFAALAKGQAARALSYGPVPAGDRSYLTAEVLRDQLDAGAIGSVQVLSVARTGQTARVNVSYQLRGPTGSHVVTDAVPMIEKDRHWWLSESAVSTKVGLAQATQRAAFAGTAFPAGSVLLFPGALPITFDTPNLQLGAPDSTVQFTTSHNTALSVEASAAGIAAARSMVSTSFAACLAGTSASAFCPVPTINGTAAVRAVPGSLRGTVSPTATDGLAVTVTPDANGLLQVQGTVSVDGHYQSLSYSNSASVVTDAKISVPISAQCYASTLTGLLWKAAT
jgi:hypothetical protein